ncbi:MAG: hypothetical protein HXX81_04955 [Campylobacterales bacterium]|nr:hypothetical protein [Campylobacterales bacterium]
MKTITIQINDNVFDKVIYFLENLPKKDIKIISDIDTTLVNEIYEDEELLRDLKSAKNGDFSNWKSIDDL